MMTAVMYFKLFTPFLPSVHERVASGFHLPPLSGLRVSSRPHVKTDKRRRPLHPLYLNAGMLQHMGEVGEGE